MIIYFISQLLMISAVKRLQLQQLIHNNVISRHLYILFPCVVVLLYSTFIHYFYCCDYISVFSTEKYNEILFYCWQNQPPVGLQYTVFM